MTIKVNRGPLPRNPERRPIFGIWEITWNETKTWRARIFYPAGKNEWLGEYSNSYDSRGWNTCCFAHSTPRRWQTIENGIASWFPNGACVAWMYL